MTIQAAKNNKCGHTKNLQYNKNITNLCSKIGIVSAGGIHYGTCSYLNDAGFIPI